MSLAFDKLEGIFFHPATKTETESLVYLSGIFLKLMSILAKKFYTKPCVQTPADINQVKETVQSGLFYLKVMFEMSLCSFAFSTNFLLFSHNFNMHHLNIAFFVLSHLSLMFFLLFIHHTIVAITLRYITTFKKSVNVKLRWTKNTNRNNLSGQCQRNTEI